MPGASFRMKPSDPPASADDTPPIVEVPDYRPVERFWPYVDLPEPVSYTHLTLPTICSV